MSQLIHKKMNEVMKAIDFIAKGQKNEKQDYQFRGIDDVFNALHKPLVEAGIFFVPEVLNSEKVSTPSKSGGTNFYVTLRVKYTFYAEDGSFITAIADGEAMDSGDKATNKAMQAALKYMLLQVFCVPTMDMEDADKDSPEVAASEAKVASQPTPQNAAAPTPEPVVPKTATPMNGEQPMCRLCSAVMRVSQKGNGMYCPNFRDEKGEHSRFAKVDLNKYLAEQSAMNQVAK